MALKKCRECGNQVSTSAKSCPNCGVKNPTQSPLVTVISVIMMFLFFGWICSFLGSDSEYKEANVAADRFSEVSLNVRSGPSTDHEVITSLQPGEQLRVITDSLGWIRISSLDDETVGWVSKKYTSEIAEYEAWQKEHEKIRQRQQEIKERQEERARANAWRTKDNREMAYIQIQDFVKDRLKAPSTADFPGLWDGFDYEKNISFLGNQTYLIISYVDAQNSFGAMIRTRFVGKIKQTGEHEWTLIDLDM